MKSPLTWLWLRYGSRGVWFFSWCWLLSGLALTVCAQPNDLHFDALTPNRHGFPLGQVQVIGQDRYGFLWFGVQGGLARYDGHSTTIYRHDPNDPHSISDHNVTAWYEDRQGNVWVGTNTGGLNRFDRASETFTRFQHDPAKPGSLGQGTVWAIYEDRAGTLWVTLTESGLARLDRASGTFTHWLPEPERPRARINRVVNLCEDRQGEFWVATQGGLLRYDRASGKFALFTLEAGVVLPIIQVYEDQRGTLWVATFRGLLSFDRAAQRLVTRFKHDPRQPDSLGADSITALVEDAAGRLWVGTEAGLNRLVAETGRFVRYSNDPTQSASLLDNLVTALFRDRAGALWIGSAGGVNRVQRGVERFTRYLFRANQPEGLSDTNVFQLCEDRAGNLWVATFGGLDKLNRATGQFEHYRHDPRQPGTLSSNTILAVLEDHTGALWVGTRDAGLNWLDPRTGQIITFRPSATDPHSLNNDHVSALYEDAAGTLWVGTGNGLGRFDRAQRRFTRFLHDPANPRSLSHSHVLGMLELRDGSFWVATEGGGLNLFDRQRGEFTVYKHQPSDAQSLSSDSVLALAEDPAGSLWIGTLGGGLNRLDRTTGRFTRFTEKDGLASNDVWGIEADDTGVLWLATAQGLTRFDPHTGQSRRYTVRDGLGQETPAQNSHLRLRSGELAFGGGGGLTIFDPRQLADEPASPPPVVLTAFKKFDQQVKFARGLGEIAEIALAQAENFFSFEFAALDFKEPARNQFAYKLEGFDPAWVYCGTRRYASYTNLDAGTYWFRVKGANSAGVWNENGVAVKVVITPPFWRTRWFTALSGALVLGLVWLAYWRRVTQLKQAQLAQEAFAKQLLASQEQERQRIAAELHDGLGQHLLIIKNHALLGLAERDDPAATEENLTTISTMTSQVLDETREIAHNLRPYQIDRFGLTRALQSMLARVAEAAPLELQSRVEKLDGSLSKEAEINLYRIVQEALNNILKHSGAQAAEVVIERQPQRVWVRISDNGKGLAESGTAALATAAQRPAPGVGFGLTGMAERARLLGGQFQLHSTPGEGVVITISIPTVELAHE